MNNRKEHVQGTFTLSGQRQSKTNVLKLFEITFKNVGGLTLSPVYEKVTIKSYVTKESIIQLLNEWVKNKSIHNEVGIILKNGGKRSVDKNFNHFEKGATNQRYQIEQMVTQLAAFLHKKK